ncbi:hypothetical protein SAMN05216569_2895 [Pseudoxanthomonas sp. CF125]|nr:hypothetical protein SAMN05216569_2895 [Pseudoxanthomonas sp. CF125]
MNVHRETCSGTLLQQLPDVADGLSARLHKLVQTRDPELADQIIRDSSGLTALALRIATALRRETERGHEQP